MAPTRMPARILTPDGQEWIEAAPPFVVAETSPVTGSPANRNESKKASMYSGVINSFQVMLFQTFMEKGRCGHSPIGILAPYLETFTFL